MSWNHFLNSLDGLILPYTSTTKLALESGRSDKGLLIGYSLNLIRMVVEIGYDLRILGHGSVQLDWPGYQRLT